MQSLDVLFRVKKWIEISRNVPAGTIYIFPLAFLTSKILTCIPTKGASEFLRKMEIGGNEFMEGVKGFRESFSSFTTNSSFACFRPTTQKK